MGQLNSRGTRPSTTLAARTQAVAEPVSSASENLEARAPVFATVMGQQGHSRRNSIVRIVHSISGRNSREGSYPTLVENRRWRRLRTSRASHSHPIELQEDPRVYNQPFRRQNGAPEVEASSLLLESPMGSHEVTQPPLTDSVHGTRHEQLAPETTLRTLRSPSYAGEHMQHVVPQSLADNMPSASGSNYRSPATVIHPQTVSSEDTTVDAAAPVSDQVARQITTNDLLRPTGTLFVLQGSVPIVANPMPVQDGLFPSARTSPLNPSPYPALSLQQNSQAPSGSQRGSMITRLLQRRNQGTALTSNLTVESPLNGMASRDYYSRGAVVPPEIANTSNNGSVEPTPAASTFDVSATRDGPQRQSTSSQNDPLGAFLSVATFTTAAELLSSQNEPLPPTSTEEINASVQMSSPELVPATPILAAPHTLAYTNAISSTTEDRRIREGQARERERREPYSSWRGSQETGDSGSRHSQFIRDYGAWPQPVRDDANNEIPVNLNNSQDTSSQRRSTLDGFPHQGFEQFLADLRSDMRMAVSHTGSPLDGRPSGRVAEVRDESITHAPENADDGRGENDAGESSHPGFMDERTRIPITSALNLPDAREEQSISNSSSPADSLRQTTHGQENRNIYFTSDEIAVAHSRLSAVSAIRTFGGMPTDNGFDLWRMHLFPSTSTVPEVSSNISSRPNTSMVPAIIVGLRAINSDPMDFLSSQPGDDPQATDDTNTGVLENINLDDRTQGFSTLQDSRTPLYSRAAHYLTRQRREQDIEAGDRYSPPNVIDNIRTFVIIVFGAYYPQDHHIFSRPETIDSFDALRELAGLASQNKVPVVTEEEIEHSGLEVLRAVFVGKFESEGRIASNCTERCLICLDDYEPEDELRLLSCKHAFHKVCVDRWLKTGQNNCPACRNKGVET